MEIKIGNQTHKFNTPLIMGILNITPDSFWSHSRYTTPVEVFTAMERMVEEGAGIIDLGAASTRPDATTPSATQEWMRLSPVLSELRRHFPNVIISVDTIHSAIVERVYNVIGPCIINDISAGEGDHAMFPTAARLQLPLIAMHKRGTPQTMQQCTEYQNILSEVHDYFASTLARAKEVGIPQIILDPGFGFAKTTGQNYQLLANLPALFTFPDVPRLVGISRKSMIYKPLSISPDEALPATSALHLYALQQGVDILRVHDVAQAVQTVQLYALLTHSS